ncbi:MAG: PH domain-containing protein [Balneolaceae bacterium]
MKKTPSKRLTPRAIRAWQWAAAGSNLFLFGIPVLYFVFWGWDGLHFWLLLFLSILVFVYYIAGICVIPYIRWRHWRYEIDEHEIDLMRGVLVRRRTLIPLSRVQHVDTSQGPILRWYNLASVTISTAATTHEISALDEMIADKVRDTISTYARLAEEDV